MRILPINNMTSAQSIQNYNADYNKEKNYKFRKNVDEKMNRESSFGNNLINIVIFKRGFFLD